MAFIRINSVNVTNGSTTVTGNSTPWTTLVRPGFTFTTDLVTEYEIVAVNSNTSITLDRPYAGATTASTNYAIIQNFSYGTETASYVADLVAKLYADFSGALPVTGGDRTILLNKPLATATAGLVLQQGGTSTWRLVSSGDNNFALQRSTNGTTWIDVITGNRTTGAFNIIVAGTETSVASATTVDLGAVQSARIAITGTTTITSFGTAANQLKFIRFTGALTLTHNATSLIIPGGVNMPTAANDTAIVASDASGNWRVLQYLQANGSMLLSAATAGVGLTIDFNGTQGSLRRTSAGEFRIDGTQPGVGNIQMSCIPQDGASAVLIGFHRYTNTTGQTYVQGYAGNGASTAAWRLSSTSSLASYIGFQGENLGIGTTVAPDKLTVAGVIAPSSDNAFTCGRSGARWSAIWAASATIQTSDGNLKENVEPVPFGLDFVNDLEAIEYTWINGQNIVEPEEYDTGETEPDGSPRMGVRDRIVEVRKGKRKHLGFISQQVKATLEKHNVDPRHYALWVKSDPNDPESEEGLRYEHLIAPLVRAVQELSAKVEAQAAEIANLQSQISAKTN